MAGDEMAADRKTPETQYSEVPALEIEFGVDQNLAFSTPYKSQQQQQREELDEVIRDESEAAGPTVRQLVTMRSTDGHARALYRLLTLPIRAALETATIIPADGDNGEAEFIDLVLHTPPSQGGMKVTFHRFMSQLLGSVFEGFAAFEKVFWMPESGPLKGKYTLKKLAHRPAETVTFLTTKTGGFGGLRQRAVNGGKTIDVFIDPEYAFYYAAQEEERKFYGVSFFQSAFYHYDKKVRLYYTAHLAAQRAAVGTRVGTVPVNATRDAVQQFSKSLSNLAFAQWMMFPEGFKVDLLKEAGGYDFLSIINHHNHMMSESILANFFDNDTGGGGSEKGSLVNFARPGDDLFFLMLRAIMNDIADQINHYIIPQLIDYNFKGGTYPKFSWGTLTDEQRGAIASTFDKLATAGQSVNATPEFMRALEERVSAEMGLEIDYELVAEREIEEAALQQAQFGVPEAGFGDPNALPEDESGSDVEADSIADFETQALSLSRNSDSTLDAYADLVRMAGDFLDSAK